MENRDKPAFSTRGIEIENPINGRKELVKGQEGLTKREYFAGLAIQGMCANVCYSNRHSNAAKELSIKAIEIADELLKQLNP